MTNRPGHDAIVAPSSITDPERMTLLTTTVVGHAIKHFFNSSLYIILPELKTALDLNNTQIGALSTVRNIAGGLSNLPAGYVADRYPRRNAEVLALSLFGIGISAFVLGFAGDYTVALVATAALVGIQAFWHPAAIGALSREFATRRGFAISLHGSGGSIGEALGPLAVGLLLAAASYQNLLRVSLLPALLAGAGVWLALWRIPGGPAGAIGLSQYLAGVRHLMKNGPLMLVLLAAGGFSGAQSIVTTFLPIHLRESIGISSAEVGLYLFLAQVSGIATQPFMGHVSDRWGRKAVLVPSLLLLGIADCGLSVAPMGPAFILVVLVLGAFLYSLMSLFLAAAVDQVEGAVHATTISLVFGVATAVAGIAPGIAGVVADSAGIPATFVFAGAISGAMALLCLVSPWQASR